MCWTAVPSCNCLMTGRGPCGTASLFASPNGLSIFPAIPVGVGEIVDCDRLLDHARALCSGTLIMRVLHFFKTYWPETFGSVERVIDAVARSTRKLGVEHHVLSINDTGDNTRPDFHGQTLHKARRSFGILSTDISLDAYRRYKRVAADADVVHLHFPWPFADLAHLGSQPQRPTILTYHSDAPGNVLIGSLYAPLHHCLLSSVDRIVATSPNYADTSPVLSRHADKTEIIPLGLDPASYPDISLETLEKWCGWFGNNFFLFVGVLRPYKGVLTLLEAAVGLDRPAVIVGAGKHEARYRARKAKLGLDNVHFVGAVNDTDKMALMQLCTALVLPSNKRSEAFGLALVEAAMTGKPMISCEIGTGTSFVNRDGITGLVVPPNDPARLSAAMRSLGDDPQLARRMGAAARRHFCENLHSNRMGQRYHALYQEVIHESHD